MNQALAIVHSADASKEPQVYGHPHLQFCITTIRCRHTTKNKVCSNLGLPALSGGWPLLSAPEAQDSLKFYLELPSHVSPLYRIQPHILGPRSQAEDRSPFAVTFLAECSPDCQTWPSGLSVYPGNRYIDRASNSQRYPSLSAPGLIDVGRSIKIKDETVPWPGRVP